MPPASQETRFLRMRLACAPRIRSTMASHGAWPASRSTGTTHPRGLQQQEAPPARAVWLEVTARPPTPPCFAACRASAGVSPTARCAFPSGASGSAPALPLASSAAVPCAVLSKALIYLSKAAQSNDKRVQGKRGPGVHLTRDLAVRPRLQRDSLSERRENGRARQNPRGGPRTAAAGPGNAPGRCCAPSPHGGLRHSCARTRWVTISFVTMVVFAHKQASLISAGCHRQIAWCTHR